MVRKKQLPRGKPPSQRRPAQVDDAGGQANEKIFNLFLFIEGDLVTKLGCRCHEMGGSDRDKLAFLQASVNSDLVEASEFPVPDRYLLVAQGGTRSVGLRYDGYMQLSTLGRHLEVFEEVFSHFDGPSNPLTCITPIVDGKPKIEAISRF
jgi:hypothetical protein